MVARPEDPIGEPDERCEAEGVPRRPHERKERECGREERQRGGERPLRPEPVGRGAGRRAGDERDSRVGRHDQSGNPERETAHVVEIDE